MKRLFFILCFFLIACNTFAATKKINEFGSVSPMADADMFLIWDTSAGATKVVTKDVLMSSPGAIGDTAADTGKFTSVTGTTVVVSDNSDTMTMSHDGTDAYFKTSDGSFILLTDEGTNKETYLDIKGKGTGTGQLRIYDEDNAEYLRMFSQSGYGYVYTDGTSENSLRLQHPGDADVELFSSSSEGDTRNLKIYGFKTGDIMRILEIGVGIDAVDTASFDGVSNYYFDGKIEGVTYGSDGSITDAELLYINTLSSNAQTQLDGKQGADATLTALAAYDTNGLVTQTASDTFVGRTITGTANQIIISNGDGVAGNPTLSLPQDYDTGATPTLGGLTLDSAGNPTISFEHSGVEVGQLRGTAGSDMYLAITNGEYFVVQDLAFNTLMSVYDAGTTGNVYVSGGLTVDGTISGNVTGDLTGNADTATLATTSTVETTTDTTSYVGLWEDSTGSLGAKTNDGLRYDASNGILTLENLIKFNLSSVEQARVGVEANAYNVAVKDTGVITFFDLSANTLMSITDAGTTGNVAVTGTFDAPTVNTGFGDFELHAMDQDVQTTDSPTLAGLTITNPIDEFSTDGTMAGNSDSAVPTEQAVVEYVGMYNVKRYGATGDNSTDDITAIQAAVDAAIAAGGGVVYFPDGIYHISTDIDLGSNIEIRGESRVNTVVKCRSNYTSVGAQSGIFYMANGSSYNDISIRNITADGNKGVLYPNYYDPGDNPFAGFSLIHLYDVDNVLIENCYLKESMNLGSTLHSCTDVLITGNIVEETHRDGITAYDVNGSYIVTNNHVSHTGDDGIAVANNYAVQDTVATEIVIANNTIQQIDNWVAGRGIIVGGVNHFTITGNTIYQSFSSGIEVTRSSSNTESGTHTGTDSDTVMTDSAATFTVDELIGATINNTTDGSSGVIEDNDATTITVAELTGGTDNSWDDADNDEYTVTVDNPSQFGVISGNQISESGKDNIYYSAGTHTGADSLTVMTDSAASFTVDALIGKVIYNTTDDSHGTITDNDATTITCLAGLAGGTDNSWDDADNDAYTVTEAPQNSYGILVGEAENINISNNVVSSNKDGGIGVRANSTLIKVTGNIVKGGWAGADSDARGIHVTKATATQVSIIGNTVSNFNREGIYSVTGNSDITCNNNFVYKNGQDTISYGIYFVDTSNLTLIGNVCLDDDDPLTGTHTGADSLTVMTDSAASFTVDALIGGTIYNITDGSYGTIIDNDGTTVEVTGLSGGSDDSWDDADNDAYIVRYRQKGIYLGASTGAITVTGNNCLDVVNNATAINMSTSSTTNRTVIDNQPLTANDTDIRMAYEWQDGILEYYGSDADMAIYHSGGAGVIRNKTGGLGFYQHDGLSPGTYDITISMAESSNNTYASMLYNGASRLNTSSVGATISNSGGKPRLTLSAGNYDPEIYFLGTSGNGYIRFMEDEDIIKATGVNELNIDSGKSFSVGTDVGVASTSFTNGDGHTVEVRGGLIVSITPP